MSEKLAEDWVALWQSELTALSADRELRESWAAMVALWASTATMALGAMRPRDDAAPGTTAPPQPPGPAPADVAPVAGVDEIAGLNRRIAELEQRLAAFDRDGCPPGKWPAG
jgi:hypothetical protein